MTAFAESGIRNRLKLNDTMTQMQTTGILNNIMGNNSKMTSRSNGGVNTETAVQNAVAKMMARHVLRTQQNQRRNSKPFLGGKLPPLPQNIQSNQPQSNWSRRSSKSTLIATRRQSQSERWYRSDKTVHSFFLSFFVETTVLWQIQRHVSLPLAVSNLRIFTGKVIEEYR